MPRIESLPLHILRNAESALNTGVDTTDQNLLLDLMLRQLKSGLIEARVEFAPLNEFPPESTSEFFTRDPNPNIETRGLIALREGGFLLSHPRREMSAAQEMAHLLHASGHLAWEHLKPGKKHWIMEPGRFRDLAFMQLFRGTSIMEEGQAENWARARVIGGLSRASGPQYLALHAVIRELEFQSPVPKALVNVWD